MAKPKHITPTAAIATAKLNSSSKNIKKKTSHGAAKKLQSGPTDPNAARAAAAASNNPFETIWSRRKFDILGKKKKGEQRRVGLSRSLAITKRENTLQKEYETNSKSSSFIDRRIGEKDDALNEFDKGILRLQHERITAEKSKKQVMQEIISKSKYYKAQKALEKEEDKRLIDEIDSNFSSLARSEVLLSLSHPSQIKPLKSPLSKSDEQPVSKDGLFLGLSKENCTVYKEEKPTEYDKLVKQLMMQPRAQPSERTKTPEEKAQEEKERLEKLEEERQRRMLCVENSSDESSDDEQSGELANRSTSGDALGDSLNIPTETMDKHGWFDDIYAKEVENKNEESDVCSEDTENNTESDEQSDGDDADDDLLNLSLKDCVQSDLGDDVDDDAVISGETALENTNDDDAGTRGTDLTAGPSELPFVIQAPQNIKDLSDLLDNRSEIEVIEAISRIRICNSIRVASNRKRMQVFYGVLLQYLAKLASRTQLKMKIVDALVKPLMEMTVEIPYFAAICAKRWLEQMRFQLCKDIKIPGKSPWPSLKYLFLLRFWVLAFPCSDFRHSVATPMLLLMCEYLMRCTIQSGRDIAVGSFLCSMVLSATKQSQKFCPEVIRFIHTLLSSCITSEQGSQLHNLFMDQLIELKTHSQLLQISTQPSEIEPLDVLSILQLPEDSCYFSSDQFKASVLVTMSGMLKECIHIYGNLSSFSEIFLPVSALLRVIMEIFHINSLKDHVKDVLDSISHKIDEQNLLRLPLQMRKQKPEPIKLLNPKFEENYVKGVDYDPDRERANMKKLKRRLRDEKKGTIRELRKDNYFLSELKDKSKRELEQEREERYGKAMAFLQEQEHAFKSGQLGKGRKRRR